VEDVIGMHLDPMPFVQLMPFAGDGLEPGSTVRDDPQAPEALLDRRIPAFPHEPLGVRGGCARIG
jgi:hypothetical protein